MEKELIITHPGSAHFDDVTAVSLLLAFFPDSEFAIERREPSDSELENPGIWIVDVGDRYEPQKHNFDHHQSLECPASFVLVAEYLGLSDSLSVLPWWKFKDSVDRFGPVRSSELFKAGDDLVNRNPVEDWLVDLFADRPLETLPVLRSFGAYLIDNAKRLKTQIDFWENARQLQLAGLRVVIGETRESYGIEEYRRLAKKPPDVVISLDRRSEGWRLYRFDNVPVDFSLISDDPEIEFAHKSGFLAKTKERLPLEKLTVLIEKAVVTG